MSGGYPENWKHAVVHFNPETKSMHFDSYGKEVTLFDNDGGDEDTEIISGYVEGLKSENKLLRELLSKTKRGYVNLLELRILPHKGWDMETEKYIAEIDEALEGGGD